MVNIRDEMLRTIRIRKNVENNMLGNDNKHEFVILSDEKIELINDDIFEKLKIAKENSFQVMHGAICSEKRFRKIVIFLKKVIRKIIEKIFSWYYFPVVERQNTCNEYTIAAIMELQKIVENQSYQISRLKELVKKYGIEDIEEEIRGE